MIEVKYNSSRQHAQLEAVLRSAEHALTWFAQRLGVENAHFVLSIDPCLAFYASAACGQDGQGRLHIMLSPLLDDDPVLLVAHEIIHCHQILRGDLVTDNETGTIWWKGQKWTAQPGAPNQDCPWEHEAYSGQEKLREAYYAAQSPSCANYG